MLKITTSPTARKKRAAKLLKRVLHNYPQPVWQGWAAALVLSEAEAV